MRTLAYWPGVEYFLGALSPGQQILEIGSGTGADARRIEAQGFSVQRTDITEAFWAHMRAEGCEAAQFDILSGAYKPEQAAIFSNAVFLHFTASQLQTALANVSASLMHDGLFCIGMKLGDFEGWRERGLTGKRYFKFWQADDLQKELAGAGFTVLHVYTTPNEDFAVITCRKA